MVRTRVDRVLQRFLEGYAVAHHTTPAKIARDVLAEWAYDRVSHTPSQRVSHTLHSLDALAKQLQLKVAVLPETIIWPAGSVQVPGAEHKKKKPQPRTVDTVREREELYWIVVAMLKEAQELSENEDLAKKAGSRIDAMKTAGGLARVGEAILAGYDRAYIQPYLDELEQLIEQLKEQVKQTDEKGPENATGSPAAT